MLEYIKKLITPDMVSLWVPSGQNRAIDLIRGNHGQCYGTHPNVPVLPSLINPSVGWVFGGDDYVEVPYNASLDNPSAFTIGGWAKSDIIGSDYADFGFIIDMGWFATPGYGIYVDKTTDKVGGYYNADRSLFCNSTLDTIWHRYILTYKEGVLSLYRNAELQDSTGLAEDTIDDLPLRIGTESKVLERYFYGSITLPFLANKGWSQAQVTNDYLNTKGMFAPRG